MITKNSANILLVDDDELSLMTTSKRLGAYGFRVTSSLSGEDIFKQIDDSKPDLVLLDKVMPAISGDEVLVQIRKKYTQVELPVLMITGKNKPEDIADSLSLGANDYLTKPLETTIAIARINTQLMLKNSAQENTLAREIFAINSMVITFNHQINNPLTVALGHLRLLQSKHPEIDMDKVQSSLNKITEIVKQIKTASQDIPKYDEYSSKTKMLKID